MTEKWDGTHTGLTIGLLSVTVLLGANVILTANQRDAAREQVASQEVTIADLRDELATSEARASDCADEAAAWQNAGAAMIDSFELYLGGFPLDLSAATRYAEDANNIDCTN